MKAISFLLLLGLSTCSAAVPAQRANSYSQQAVLQAAQKSGAAAHVIKELEHAKIIPQVLDKFEPSLLLDISWGPKAQVRLGNTLKPERLGDAEKLSVHLSQPGHSSVPGYHIPANVVLALTDPDARSRENPDWSEMCHTIRGVYMERNTHIGSTDELTLSFDSIFHKADDRTPPFRQIPYEVVSYKPPAPPPETGKHRYVWVLLSPSNGTSERVYPVAPADRKHWGYNGTRVGVQRWAKENGLAVVGANFFYSKNKKQ